MTNFDPNNLPDRPLSNEELRQLIESNARAIRETRAIADSNARAIEANSNEIAESRRALVEVANLIREAAAHSDDRIDRLAELVRSFVASQIGTNHELDDRITALESIVQPQPEEE